MCFPSLFIQTIVDISRSKSEGKKLFFLVYIYRILRFLGLSEFPLLELIHITTPIGTTFLGQRQAQMKSVEPSTGTLKRLQGEASTIAPASGIMLVAKETFVDPTAAMDPSSGADDIDLTVAPPLLLYAMMESFMTT